MRHWCSSCGHHWAWQLGDGRLKCRRCGKRYRFPSVWDVFRLTERAKRQLVEYFVLGVPVYRLRFRGPASPPTLKRYFRLIRAVLAIHEQCRDPLGGSIECDETMFGGKHSGKRGWGAAGKIVVLGILQRDGLVRVFPVHGRGAERLLPLIRRTTKPGSLYYTDDWHAYGSLAVRGGHVVVRKEKGQPKGRDHLNGIEGFWSYAKHWLYHYRGLPKKFFHLFLGEISFRFNYRQKDLFPLVIGLLNHTPYADLKHF
jgi:transposase